MSDLSALPLLASLPVFFLCGMALGYIYFIALRGTADLIVNRGHPLLGMALTIGRLALLGAGLYLIVLAGGLALLAALTGVLCARTMVLRQTGNTGS